MHYKSRVSTSKAARASIDCSELSVVKTSGLFIQSTTDIGTAFAGTPCIFMISNDAQFTRNHHYGLLTSYIYDKRGGVS